jgi:hypothetical protein
VRDIHLVFLPVDARWDVLRDDPRFQQILGRSRFCGKLSALVGGHCEPVERTDVADESVSISERFETRTVTSANIDGIWTATANTIAGDGMVSGLVTFTGPADKTRAMGACLVRQFESATGGAPCDTVDDCNSAPAEIPSGSNRYCVPSNNSGRNYCHYRPGPRSDYCVGSPALNYASIEPGNYRIDIAASPESKWRALACFNACANSPPAISEIAIVQ